MEQCTEQQGVWNVPPRSLFVSTFSPFSHPFPPLSLSLYLSRLFFSRCEARYYFYVPLHWQPWLRIDLKKTRVTEPRLARATKFYVTGVRATGNSVNSKSARDESSRYDYSQSLFIRSMVLRFHGGREVPVESEFRCYAPSNRGTSVRLITSRLFEHARLDIDFSEKKSDTILRFEIS